MIPPRIGFAIALTGTLAAAAFWLNRGHEDKSEAPMSGLDTRLNYALQDFEGQFFDSEGRLAGHIQAPLLTNDAQTGVGYVEQPRFKLIDQGNLWTIAAESATLSPDRERVSFGGNVNAECTEPGGNERVEIRTSEVTLEIESRILNSSDEVVIVEAGNTLEAMGFELDMINNKYRLQSEVRAHYALP